MPSTLSPYPDPNPSLLLQYLAYTSILGDVAVVCGIFGTIWGGFRHLTLNPDLTPSCDPVREPKSWPEL